MSFILFTFLICSSLIYAQTNPGAKQVSMANSDVALADDAFSIFNNPAGLAQLNWREFGAFYSPSPFGIKEMAYGSAVYNEPFSFGSLAASFLTYGYELYRENSFTGAISYNYNNKLLGGLSLSYHTFSIKNYGTDGVFHINLGLLYYLYDDIRLGFSVYNINRGSIGNIKDQIPTILNTGLSIDVVKNFTLNIAVEKDIRYNASLCAGVNYDIIENISLRSGFANEPSKFSAGVGINFSAVSFDYSIFTHPYLDLTHQAGILVSFDGTTNRRVKIKSFLGIE